MFADFENHRYKAFALCQPFSIFPQGYHIHNGFSSDAATPPRRKPQAAQAVAGVQAAAEWARRHSGPAPRSHRAPVTLERRPGFRRSGRAPAADVAANGCGVALAVKHQQSLEQLLQSLLRQKTPVFLRKRPGSRVPLRLPRCRSARRSNSNASSAGDMQLLPLAQGPRHHMPAGARQSLGILFSHHHQIHANRQRQGAQRRPQRTQRLLPFLRGERGLGHHHQQIDVGIGPPIPPSPGAKQQHTPWPGFNPGQGGSHRLQVGVDGGGWDRHLCRVGRSLGSEPIGIQQGYLSKSAASPTSGMEASSSARLRREGLINAAVRMARCSASALRPWATARFCRACTIHHRRQAPITQP